MFMLRLAPILMLFTLLTGPSLFIPTEANALCCPCWNPQGNCQWRGTPGCATCRASGTDLFQLHAAAITPASAFNTGHDSLSLTLPSTNLPKEIVAHVRGNRSIGSLASRLLAGPEFRIKSWCLGSMDKSV